MENQSGDKQATIGPTIGRFFLVGSGLFLFGVAFDRFTSWFNRHPLGEQRSAFLVVVGTAVTLIFRQFLPGGLIWDLFAFACSGLPMILGQYTRFEARKQAALQRHLGRR